MYRMTTISNNTRIRTESNTAGSILAEVPANVQVTGTELFTAPTPLVNASGAYQYKGDKWLKINYNGVTGWMAYIHKGVKICDNFTEVIDGEPPVAAPTFPESFTLTDPQGNRAEYIFVKAL